LTKLPLAERKRLCVSDQNGSTHPKGNSSYKRLDIQTIHCLEHDVVIFFPVEFLETGQVIVEDWKVFKKEVKKRQKNWGNALMNTLNA